MQSTKIRRPSKSLLGAISPIPSKKRYENKRWGGLLTTGINFRPTASCENISIKFLSPVNKIRQELSEVIKELLNPSAYIVKAKSACKALDICSSEEGVYQKEMKIIVSSIHDSIFIEKMKVKDEILFDIYEKHTEAILDKDYTPYFYVAESALDLLAKSRKEIQMLKGLLLDKKNGILHIDLQIELKNKDLEITNLKSFIAINIPNHSS